MKKHLLYVSLFLFSCQTNADSKKTDITPFASSNIEFSDKIIEIVSPEAIMLSYLSTHFNKIQDTIFIKKPEFMIAENTKDTICGYIISFKEGHSFKHEQECNEWGEIVTVSFKNYTPSQVREIVELLFKNDEYDWYDNRTEYRPQKYYERDWTFRIIENVESTHLEFAYSWI
jgi:hypothetical protein